MRPITLLFTLAATLHLLTATALAGGWTWPVRGPVITAYRNGDDPYAGGQHRGVDIGAPVGARVVAAAGGTVTFAGVAGTSGLTVSERTADGRFDLSYLHLSTVSVHRGEDLAAGAALGAVGTSGQRSADAPHLHFGVREAGSHTAYRDPLDFLMPPAAPGDAPDPAPAPAAEAQPVVAEPARAGAEPAPAGADLAPGGAEPAPSTHAAPHVSLGPAPQIGVAPAAAPHSTLGAAPQIASGPRSLFGPAAAARRLPGRTAAAGPGHASQVSRAPAAAAPSGPAAGRTAHSPGARTAAGPALSDRPAPGRHRGGLDLGWLAACLGLIAAATALGHPDGARRAVARGQARLGSLLRPLRS
ncbi:MAG: hypothetical protein QOF55_2462 [Thermoleophilaceae bacterium]|nr:hypothetical protein [Thermoleophilaceae bacterium]